MAAFSAMPSCDVLLLHPSATNVGTSRSLSVRWNARAECLALTGALPARLSNDDSPRAAAGRMGPGLAQPSSASVGLVSVSGSSSSGSSLMSMSHPPDPRSILSSDSW